MSHTIASRRTLRLGVSALLGGIAAMVYVSTASAQECASSADCAAGFECVKGMSAPGCATPPDCPDPTPVESDTGWCEQLPVTCQTDADCLPYLKCVANQSQTCWADTEGNTGCDPIDPNAPKTCEYVTINCEANTDCPTDFECVDVPVACPGVACAPGEECPTPPECTGSSKTCTPQEINCEISSDCPTDWACADVGPDCATPPPSTSTGGGSTEPAPAPGMLPQDTTTNDCAAPVMLCIPPGFASGYGTDEAAGQPGGATGDSKSTTAPADDAGGCTVSSAPAGGNAWLAALSAAAIASIVSRRLRRR